MVLYWRENWYKRMEEKRGVEGWEKGRMGKKVGLATLRGSLGEEELFTWELLVVWVVWVGSGDEELALEACS